MAIATPVTQPNQQPAQQQEPEAPSFETQLANMLADFSANRTGYAQTITNRETASARTVEAQSALDVARSTEEEATGAVSLAAETLASTIDSLVTILSAYKDSL